MRLLIFAQLVILIKDLLFKTEYVQLVIIF